MSKLYVIPGFALGSYPLARLCTLVQRQQPDCEIILLDLPKDDLLNYLTIYSTQIIQQLHDRDAILGWSLGGQIATLISQRVDQMVGKQLKLITLASNPKFCAQQDWHHAMSVATFERFSARYRANSVRQLNSFIALCSHGEQNLVKSDMLNLRRNLPLPSLADIYHLQLLRELDTRNLIISSTSQLHVFAQNDALVPVGVAQHISHGMVKVIAHASHLLPLTHASELSCEISSFLNRK